VETQAQTADAGLHQQVASLERRLAESAKARETADQGVTALAGELDDAKQGLATREAMLATQTTALRRCGPSGTRCSSSLPPRAPRSRRPCAPRP
jgi:septal ring factor EnvC (AmiA/AmiB activator)